MPNEATWQFVPNEVMDNTTPTTNWKNMVWFIKGFLLGQIGGTKYKNTAATTLSTLQGFWTCDHSCNSAILGTPGEGADYWGTQGASTGNTGVAASIVVGASIIQAVRLTGLTGMTSGSVGKMMTISGAAAAGNNSKTNTPWLIVNFISATSVDILCPSGVTSDSNNGAITWTERDAYSRNDSNLVGAAPGIAHSWIVLKSPVLRGVSPWYLTLDMASATIGNISVALSKTAPTGGTLLARPTSPDEIVATNWTNASLYSAGQGRVSAAMTVSGEPYFAFSQAGTLRAYLLLQALRDSKAEDLHPVWMAFTATGTTPIVTAIQAASNVLMQRPDGAYVLAAPAANWMIVSTAANPFTIFTADTTDSAIDDLPIYIVTTSAGNKSIRGRLADIRWAPSSVTTPTHEPAAGTPQSMVLGNIWMPASAIPVL